MVICSHVSKLHVKHSIYFPTRQGPPVLVFFPYSSSAPPICFRVGCLQITPQDSELWLFLDFWNHCSHFNILRFVTRRAPFSYGTLRQSLIRWHRHLRLEMDCGSCAPLPSYFLRIPQLHFRAILGIACQLQHFPVFSGRNLHLTSMQSYMRAPSSLVAPAFLLFNISFGKQ